MWLQVYHLLTFDRRTLWPECTVTQRPSGALAGSASRAALPTLTRAALPVPCLAAAVLGPAQNWSL